MKLAFALLALSTAAAAQTTATKPVTHHRTSTTSATSSVVVNPPGAPKVPGIPKTLYSLKYIDIKVGTGEVATTHHWLTVHYTGWLPNGTKFDSSVDRKEPFPFPYGAHRVIIGWDTGFEGMRVGGTRRLYVPWELAYGELGTPPHMGPKQNLIFDVELLGVSDTPPASMMPKPAPAPATAPKPATPAPPAGDAKPAAPETPPTPAPAPKPAEPQQPATPPPSAK